MQRPAFFLRFTGLVPLLAVGVLLALFWYATAPGLSGTGDSRYYLFAARSLRRSGVLLHPDGTPYRYWPPLYPVLLAGLRGSLIAIRLMHGAALVGALLLWHWLGKQLLPPPASRLFPLLLALSTPALVTSKFVWAETGFAFLVAVYAVALWQWSRTRRLHWAVLATAAGALLPLQRTAGFFLLAGIGVALVWQQFQAKTTTGPARAYQPFRFSQLAGHGLVCAAGGVAWHWYALLVAAPVFYQQNRGWPQLAASAADYGLVFTRWLLPVRAGWREGAATGWLWALVLPVLLLLLWPAATKPEPSEVPDPQIVGSRPQPDQVLPAAQSHASAAALAFRRLLWSGVTVYVLAMLVSTTFTRSAAGLYDAERYASALYAPVLLLAMGRLPALPGARSRWVHHIILTVLLLYSAGRVIQNARQLRQRPTLTQQVVSILPPKAAPAANQGRP